MEQNAKVHDLQDELAPILPEGWQEGDSLLSDEEGDPLEGLMQEEESLPTTEEATPSDRSSEAEAPSASRVLTLKVNHETKEVDFGAMSDEELIALAQKGYAFDALKRGKGEESTEAPSPDAAETDDTTRRFRRQLQQLRAVYPDVAEMPESVMRAYFSGADLLSAYSAHRIAESERTAGALRRAHRRYGKHYRGRLRKSDEMCKKSYNFRLISL